MTTIIKEKQFFTSIGNIINNIYPQINTCHGRGG